MPRPFLALLLATLLPVGPARTASLDALPAASPYALPAASPDAEARPAACRPERVQPIDAAAGPLHLGTETYPQTLRLAEREVVLTFDDGPAPETTPAVLRALDRAKVHATFFLIGRNAAAHPALVRQEVEGGHSVGHHSMSHPSFTLRGFDEERGIGDIEAGIAADERAAYGAEATPGHPHVPFFRFPGFADTPALLAHLDRRGIAVFGSDLWAADWLMMTPDAERARVLALLARRPRRNGIILFHDTKAQTATMLPALLADLCREGYRIVHLVPRAGAGAPQLDEPRPWHSETEAILRRMHLRGGMHHGDQAAPATGPAPAGSPPQPAPAAGFQPQATDRQP